MSERDDPVPGSPGAGGQRDTMRLRAAFAADIANYTALVSVEETRTIDALSIVRKVAREELEIHGGWLFGLPGDGIFALFESAVDAVRCGLQVQQRLAAMPIVSQLKMRIGIHLGDVRFRDGLPFGETLVIAARLESLAEPGTILISASVMDAVAARISATFEEKGVRSLKHSPKLIATFAVSPPPRPAPVEEEPQEDPLDHTVLNNAPELPHSPLRRPLLLDATVIAPLPRAVPFAMPDARAVPPPAPPAPPPVDLSDVDLRRQASSPPLATPPEPGPAAPPPDPLPDERPAAAEAPAPSIHPPSLSFLDPDPFAELRALVEPPDAGMPARPDPAVGEEVPPEPIRPPKVEVFEARPPAGEFEALPPTREPEPRPYAPQPAAAPLPAPPPLVLEDSPALRAAEPVEPVWSAPPVAPEPPPVAVPPSPSPPPPSAPAPSRLLDETRLNRLAMLLTTHLGPVAKVIVRRRAEEIGDPERLLRSLAQDIPRESERPDFMQHARDILLGRG
ncbi:MAG: adenylate/guanylate cyclase domain-containing protein [Alsobacter sp.]